MKLGYVPIDREGEAASKTLEYAFDDWDDSPGPPAKLGRKDVAATFTRRAGNWRNAYDAKNRLHARTYLRRHVSASRSIRARAATATDYTEGNAWAVFLVRAAGRPPR